MNLRLHKLFDKQLKMPPRGFRRCVEYRRRFTAHCSRYLADAGQDFIIVAVGRHFIDRQRDFIAVAAHHHHDTAEGGWQEEVPAEVLQVLLESG